MILPNNRIIDHLVYAVPDLDAAIAQVGASLGITPTIGGRHLDQGTKNALLHIGDKTYLEIIAVDEENTAVQAPRWMAVDQLTKPRLTRWSLKSDNLEKDTAVLQIYKQELGWIHTGARQTTAGDTLRWRMSLPQASPLVEIVPFFTDWGEFTVHPCDSLRPACFISSIAFAHPQASEMERLFTKLGLEGIALNEGKEANISVTINGPAGLLYLE